MVRPRVPFGSAGQTSETIGNGPLRYGNWPRLHCWRHERPRHGSQSRLYHDCIRLYSTDSLISSSIRRGANTQVSTFCFISMVFNEFRSWVCIIADINGLKSCKISRDMYDWVSEAAKMDSEHLFLPSVRKHALKAPRASLYICNGLYQVD